MTRSGFFNCFLVVVSLVFSHGARAANQSGDLLEIATDSTLKNVYFFQTTNTAEVLVSLTMLAGEVDSIAPEGLSHYLEHLVF